MRTPQMMAILWVLGSVPAFAESDYAANVDIGYRLSRGEKQSARFMEYKDFNRGVLSGAAFDYFDDGYHTAAMIRDVGRQDQSYQVVGGKYYSFNYKFWYEFTPHNLSFNGKNFFSSADAGKTLTYTPTFTAAAASSATYAYNVPDVSTWSPVTYSLQKRDLGATLDFSAFSPLFATLSTDRIFLKGTKPTSGVGGMIQSYKGNTSSSGMTSPVEFPEPVDQVTTNVSLETGYKSDWIYASATGTLSKFATDLDYMSVQNHIVTSETITDKYSMSPDSDMKKLSVQVTAYHLPLDSTLQVRGSTEKITNSITLLNTIWTPTKASSAATYPTYALTTLTLNDPFFKGDIAYKTASAVWSVRPLEDLDVETYYRFNQKKNHSSEITFTNGSAVDENEHFGYRKNNVGIDLGYRLPLRTKFKSGFEYLAINREDRSDHFATFDRKVFGELKNNYLDLVSGKIRYEYILRTSKFGFTESGSPATPNDDFIKRFVKRFDATDKTQNALKASVSIAPLDDLDIGVLYAYKKNNYKQTKIGLQHDNLNEWTFDLSYRLPRVFRVVAFADLEKANRHGYHRAYAGSNSNPDAAPSYTSSSSYGYNWEEDWKDSNYLYGVTFEIPVIEDKLQLSTTYSQAVANGLVDFTLQEGTPTAAGTPVDIGNMTDYRKNSFLAQLDYQFNNDLSASLGFLWEKLKSDDIQFSDYVFQSNTNKVLFSGAYADNSYVASTGFVTVAYKF